MPEPRLERRVLWARDGQELNEEVEMHATKAMTLASMLVLAVGMSACGTTQSDRALTGGGLGAGVGALGGAAVGHRNERRARCAWVSFRRGRG